jgi:hypothetical protein
MADWKLITQYAENAKRQMILDQTGGEKEFESLFDSFGPDGMLFFKRAEAYEACADTISALADFRKAKALFPMDVWKEKAQAGIDRNLKKYVR